MRLWVPILINPLEVMNPWRWTIMFDADTGVSLIRIAQLQMAQRLPSIKSVASTGVLN